MPPESTTARLRRILVMLPWVMANTPTVAECCARFSITPAELASDIGLLFVCGLPPFGPGDLIEAEIVGDRVVIRMADYLDRPPRLTRAEAIALLVMGRALSSLPDAMGTAPLATALDKLQRAITPAEAEQARTLAERITVELASPGADLVAEVRSAIADRARIQISYFTARRDEMTERQIDPLLLLAANGDWYVVAHDHASGEERNFRVDRIRSLTRTGEQFDRPDDFTPSRYEAGPVVSPSPTDIAVTLSLAPGAAWMAEAIPHDSQTSSDGQIELRLRTTHLAWPVRLMLSAGSAARAVAPSELAEATRDAARRALERYGGELRVRA